MALYNATYTGPYKEKGTYQKDAAGAESNVAVNLQKLGLSDLETIWVSRLGDDEAGAFILGELDGRTRIAAQRYKRQKTGISYLNHLEDQRHVKTYYRRGSAASRLEFEDVEPYLKDSDLLHVTGITPALSDTCRRTVFEALRYAKGHGIPVSFDANYREPLWSPADAKPVFQEMLGYSAIFKVGYDEAEVIWAKGLSPEQYAKYFQQENVPLVIVTRGSDGAIACDGNSLIEHPGYSVDVVDPIGAGDAFIAGFLGGILRQHTLKEFFGLDPASRKETLSDCVTIANVCGALTCTRRGDTAAMPTMREVREFIGKHDTSATDAGGKSEWGTQ